jgi:hypothetical protein
MEEEDIDPEISNSMAEGKLQEYKDLARPPIDLKDLAKSSSSDDLCLMGIDVTYSNKVVRDQEGTSEAM